MYNNKYKNRGAKYINIFSQLICNKHLEINVYIEKSFLRMETSK